MTQNKKRGYVYVANGEGYIEEAIYSANSLKEVSPESKIVLITNDNVSNDIFDLIQKPSFSFNSPIDKICAIEADLDEIIYLDTDTYIISDISELFLLLSKFDIAASDARRPGWYYELDGVPKVFTEYNTGVIVFRKNQKVIKFFEDWKSIWTEIQEKKLVSNQSDQPAFRKALFESDLRVVTIPFDYHFRSEIPNFAFWDVKLIHSRDDYKKITKMINSKLGVRAYIPNIGVFQGFLGNKNIIKDIFTFVKNSLITLIKNPKQYKNRPNKWD